MSYFSRRIGTNILLVKDQKVLLARRVNTGWADGKYALPGGHLEENETALQAAVRELKEELGIIISEDRLNFFATALVTDDDEYVYFEFYVEIQDEVPINAEPNKCSDISWFGIKDLPNDLHDIFRTIIEKGYLNGEKYLEIGYKS